MERLVQIKQETSSSNDPQCSKASNDDDEKIELLEYERNVMLDTYADDVLFVLASGLGLERLMLHHLHLYTDPELLVFVINTTQMDEAFFVSRLRKRNEKCIPKIITSETLANDREELYMEGGIHFITSRILMVDLLQDRVPVNNVAGIIVYRAHQILSGFQESFILRLYREKKKDGFVKAFCDNPTVVSDLGVLQRLVNRLYVRRVRIIPRFDVEVRRTLDSYAPEMVEMSPSLPHSMRKVQSILVDIIRTCVRELKQTISSTTDEPPVDDDSLQTSVGLVPSRLELQLNGRQFSTTEKQQRLLRDLKQLRSLLCQAEELDPITLNSSLRSIKADKDLLTNNSGWLFTQTSSQLFSESERLCKVKTDQGFTILEPPKWNALYKTLEEIRNRKAAKRIPENSTILLIASNHETCRQLRDLITWGIKKFTWVQQRQNIEDYSSQMPLHEPEAEPFWDPSQVLLFANYAEGESRSDIVNEAKANQKKAVRKGRKRRRLIVEEIAKRKQSKNQTRLVQFGIVRYKKLSTDKAAEKCSDDDKDPESDESSQSDSNASSQKDVQLVIVPNCERYNLIRQLEQFMPPIVILYQTNLVTLRILEVHKACNPEKPLCIFVIMYKESTEEERYLCALRREQIAFEDLVREQGNLMVYREYDTAREEPHRLKLCKSTRDAGGRTDENDDESPKVIVDMREFNCELPIVLYTRGIDLIPATLEVGDYILSPNVAVERKALDDLTQSLYSGRIFKQIEQMLRHYRNVILLIEGNSKDDFRKVNGGPFQGELSRRCRETRSLLTVLVRSYPRMSTFWTLNAVHSAEMFEEVKLKEDNPDIAKAVAIKSDLEGTVETSDSNTGASRLNSVLQRHLMRLPQVASGDVVRIMSNDGAECLLDVINANRECLAAITGNSQQASMLHTFFNTNYKLKELVS